MCKLLSLHAQFLKIIHAKLKCLQIFFQRIEIIQKDKPALQQKSFRLTEAF